MAERNGSQAARDPRAPGGDHAVERGCTCPVLDNGRGYLPLARDRGGWWITIDCPMHAAGGPLHAHTEIPAQPGSRPIPVYADGRTDIDHETTDEEGAMQWERDHSVEEPRRP